MPYNHGDHYLDHFGADEQVIPIREELVREAETENTLRAALAAIQENIRLEQRIQDHMRSISSRLSLREPNQYQWWVKHILMYDEGRERYRKYHLEYTRLLAEAKACLQRLEKLKQPEYGLVNEIYTDILYRMHELFYYDHTIRVRGKDNS